MSNPASSETFCFRSVLSPTDRSPVMLYVLPAQFATVNISGCQNFVFPLLGLTPGRLPHYFCSMFQGIEFFTATCLNWQMLLDPDDRKDILMDSLKFMVDGNRIWLYGFVIMPNHIHLMWRRQNEWVEKSTEQMYLKYTAQKIKFKLVDSDSSELKNYKSTQGDRKYHFWERRPYKATMYNREVAKQKIDYMHYNPVKAGLCNRPEDYKYSSARFYELNVDDWGFITHYAEHL